MPSIAHTLNPYDLGFIQLIAESWALDLNQHRNPTQLRAELAAVMAQPAAIAEMLDLLSDEGRQALTHLVARKGRMPWQAFVRAFGDVRLMGAGRRDRERPHLSPVTITEQLWYRGLIGRAFMQTGSEPQEFAYIPDEILTWLQNAISTVRSNVFGTPATPDQCRIQRSMGDTILDDLTTLAAARRMGETVDASDHLLVIIEPALHDVFLDLAGMVSEGVLDTSKVKESLEQSRATAMSRLFSAWRGSVLNELALLPELALEGNWTYDPTIGREALLSILGTLPGDTWFLVDKFIDSVKALQPDFLRPAANYESWHIREKTSGQFLRGFESWDAVEGRYLRYMLLKPCHWLGLIDLAAVRPEQTAQAFRLSTMAPALLSGQLPAEPPPAVEPVRVSNRGIISVHRLASRSLRYQIARFCEWLTYDNPAYSYRISAGSMQNAASQDLTVQQLLRLLKHSAKGSLPPAITKALTDWEAHGTRAAFESATLLRFADGEAAAAFLTTSGRHVALLQLNETTFLVSPVDLTRLRELLLEAGLLSRVALNK